MPVARTGEISKTPIRTGAFLFPQMVLDPQLRREMGEEQWRPGFVEYLFLAYNTSTAFSPTDVPVAFALGQGSDDGSSNHLARYC